MKRVLGVAFLYAAALAERQEPTPRRLTAVPVQVKAQFLTISGARELRTGQLLLTDAKRPAVYLVDPKTGAATKLGSPGADSGQYVQPGGIYAGRSDTIFVVDRGQTRLLVISPTGAIVGIRSIALRGVTGSSDADVDYKRVDSRGLAYFTQREGGGRVNANGLVADSVPLLRFDPARQVGDTVTLLRTRLQRLVSQDGNMRIYQTVIGSPEDTWGVAPDGRVAVVRAEPYRVEWHAGSGRVTRGPVIGHEALSYTAAEKEAISARSAASSASVGMVGAARTNSSGAPREFAPNKPPFEPNGEAIVSPNGHIWVPRTLPFGAAKTVYDIFDGQGERADRVELPARSRVIGFGAGCIYAAERDERGAVSLRKYRL